MDEKRLEEKKKAHFVDDLISLVVMDHVPVDHDKISHHTFTRAGLIFPVTTHEFILYIFPRMLHV